jgi:acetolactate synthase small subunit
MFKADDRLAELTKYLITRLEPIESVEAIDPERSVVREVALLKTKKLGTGEHWRVVEQIERAGGKIIDSKEGAIIAEISGEHEQIELLISKLGPGVLREIARSGHVYISSEI